MKQKKSQVRKWRTLNFGGLLFGLAFYCLALTPSLLPTPPVLAGVVAGVSFAIGYGIGVGLSWAWRKTITYEPPKDVRKYAWRTMIFVAPLLIIAYGVWNASWQNQVRRLIGESQLEGPHVVTILLVAFITATFVIFLSRAIRYGSHKLGMLAGRVVPARIAGAVGVLLMAWLLMQFYSGVLVNTFVAVSNAIYSKSNSQTDEGTHQPASDMRSGSSKSLVPWGTLGREGRNFVAGGPSEQQLTQLNGHDGKEPIRVYVGLQSAETIADRAQLAVKELERTGAFEREVLVVMTATGTGWIEPQSADSLEYIWNGDSALATVQYSYLPSWISFLVDQQRATAAGRDLFNAVYAKWRELPSDERPKLIAYGLSLGSFGSQAAFSGVEDLQNRTDGALFLGTPSFSQPWEYFTENRDRGSPEWQPTYQNGQAVRFGAHGNDVYKPNRPWLPPRVIYMQHASDPVVWWSPNLILHKPDWLSEPRGPDVSPDMQWYPFVTFAQVTVNQFVATSVPNGHGHNYGDSIVDAWTALASPSEWNAQKSQKLQTIIDNYPPKDY